MFLQGQLQVVFDALYAIGAIDPVLKMDWSSVTEEMNRQPQKMKSAMARVNACRGNYSEIVSTLTQMDSQSINFVALEVAREYCEFQDRSDLH